MKMGILSLPGLALTSFQQSASGLPQFFVAAVVHHGYGSQRLWFADEPVNTGFGWYAIFL